MDPKMVGLIHHASSSVSFQGAKDMRAHSLQSICKFPDVDVGVTDPTTLTGRGKIRSILNTVS